MIILILYLKRYPLNYFEYHKNNFSEYVKKMHNYNKMKKTGFLLIEIHFSKYIECS